VEWLTRRSLELPRVILLLAVAITLWAAAGLPRVPTEVGYRGVLGDAHPSVLELDAFIDRFGGGLPVFAVYSCAESNACDSAFDEAPLLMARSVEESMSRHPLVRRVESPASSPILVPGAGGFEVRRLVEDGRIAADREALRDRALADGLWEGTLVSGDGRVGAIVVQLASSDSRTTSSVVPALRETLAPFEAEGFRFHLVGDPVDFAVAGGELQRETPRIVPLMIAIVAGIVFALLRSWRMTGLALLTTGLAVLVALGAMGWLGWPQSELTQALAPAVLVIGVCGSIHVLARYASLAGAEPGADRRELILRVAREIGAASLICALTTVAGFLSFSTSDFASFLRFGAIASIGVLAALLLDFTLLPVLLVRLPVEAGAGERFAGAWDRALQLIVRISERRGAMILTVSGLLLFVCGLGVARLEVDVDERELLGSNSEVVRWAEFVEQNLRRSDTLEIELSAPEGASVLEPAAMAVIEDVAARLPSVEGLGRVRSVLDPLRHLNRVLHDDDPAYLRTGDSRAANRQLLLVLRLDEGTQPDLWIDAAERSVRLSVEADPVAKSRRIAIVDEVEAQLASALPQGWSFRLTGPFALYLDLVREMQATQVRSFASSTIAISLLFWVFLWTTGSPLWTALWWALVGMLPNLLPVVATLGAMGLWGIPLDVGTIMVGAIVLGIAVDDTIHFITHYRSGRNAGAVPRDAIATTMRRAGRAIVTTSFALALGFFALTLSSWQSIASFGLLSGIAILAALAADLFVLPALILGLSPSTAGPERQEVSRTLAGRGRGVLALLAVLASGAMLHATATGMAEPARPRPACRWLASGHVLPPGSLDASCPIGTFERVEVLEAGGRSVRPHEEESLWPALAGGQPLRARVALDEASAWVEVPLLGLGASGPRALPRLAVAGLSVLALVGLAVFLLAYSSAPAAVPLLALCTSLAVLVTDALCGALARLPPWPALVALGLAPAAAAHLALSFPRPGGLLASAPGVVRLVYVSAVPMVAILLWGAHEYPALVRAASAACATLAGLVWCLLLLKCSVTGRESPLALERARARAASSGTVLAAVGLAALWLATEVLEIGSPLDLVAAGAVVLPLPIGYALARYQLNDVRPHVRQIASYGLLHFAWAVALAMLLAELFHRRSPQLFADPAAVLGLLSLTLLLAGGARDAVWHSLRRGIPTLGARLREVERRFARDLEPLREPDATASLACEAMHVGLGGPGVRCLLRADTGWRLSASFGPVQGATPALAENAARACAEGPRPIHLAFEGGAEGPWADRLRDAGVELVVPLRSQDELLGIALVGASKDGLPYTRPELAFAGAIAARAGLAIQRARLAEDLLRAERFEAVGRIAAGLAHDLGKPLSLVYQRARAMGRESLAPEQVRRHAESIATLADEALATLDHLVEQGRADRRPGAPVPLADLIARAVQTAERLHGPDCIALRLTPSLPEISAARDLQAVLANLLDNALRASPGVPVEVYAVADGEEIVIEVIDHGVGMDEETLRRAFTPFFTTRSRQGGRGIGLAASQALVEQLGGMLGLESQPGRGTRAQIRLPAAPGGDAHGRT
jgi:predicted RND superfamily exporter protein/signal transduction histidine kinase